MTTANPSPPQAGRASDPQPDRRDGFWRPLLGRKRDVTDAMSHRPGVTVYEIPVTRNLIRRGTLRVTLASYTNGDLSVRSDYVKEPWEEDAGLWERRKEREYEERRRAETDPMPALGVEL